MPEVNVWSGGRAILQVINLNDVPVKHISLIVVYTFDYSILLSSIVHNPPLLHILLLEIVLSVFMVENVEETRNALQIVLL